MTSNIVVNLNKVRAANTTERPESAVLIFDYHAPESSAGQTEQRPLVRVEFDSLRKTQSGEWTFKGTNLYRVGETDRGIRTYRVSRINGVARRP